MLDGVLRLLSEAGRVAVDLLEATSELQYCAFTIVWCLLLGLSSSWQCAFAHHGR